MTQKMEQSVLLVKPEAVRYESTLLEQLRGHEFMNIQRVSEREPDAERIGALLYPDEPRFAMAAADHLWNQPIVWLFVEAPRAVEKLSRLVGTDADPTKCRLGTLRYRFFSRARDAGLLPSLLNDSETGLNFSYHFNGFSCPRTEQEYRRWLQSDAVCKSVRAA